MPIITISRQLGSLGTEIATLLSDKSGCSCLDKNSLEQRFAEHGVSKENMERFDEKKPGFWDLFKTDKARYLHFLKGVVFEFVHGGNGIILGRGGQVVLGHLPGVLNVRIISSLEVRKVRVMERFACDEDHALKIIQHNDNERAGFHKFFFDENWEDQSLYDLIINTGSFSAHTAAQLIGDLVNTPEFKSREEATTRILDDLCMEHEVKTAIVFEQKILVQFLEVLAVNGTVTLRGIVDNKEDIQLCGKIAAAKPGVKEVRNEIYYSPITSSYGIHY